MDLVFECIFWLSIAALLYTFIGYGFLIVALARFRGNLICSHDGEPTSSVADRSVCVIVVAYNEGARIRRRVLNILASSYPAEKLSVVVVSDGSTDRTLAEVNEIGDPRVEALALPHRSGKAAGLNAGVAAAHSEIVVFTDARQEFQPDTIYRLASHFENPVVGGVSGSLEIQASQTGAGKGIAAYWRLEKQIRAAESRWDSCIGCTGAIYAIRRELYRPIPPDTVLDDVVIPMLIAGKGFRVLHDPAAVAFDPQPLEPAAESVRKKRTLAGNFQMLFRYPQWLDPFHSRLWWQLVSHKYLRLAGPLFLVSAFVSNAVLARGFVSYRFLFAAQSTMYLLALLGLCFPAIRSRVCTLPAGFVFLNLSTVHAFAHYFRSKDLHRWSEARSAVKTAHDNA